ncbi:MAG: MFS transporter [Pseudomonadales bacterium]
MPYWKQPAPLAGKRAAFFYGYPLAGYAFFMGFVASSFFLHSRGIFFPLWMEEFAVARTEISFAISLTLFVGACAAPLTGHFLDRYPVRIIVALGCAWLACGYLLLQFVDGYLTFLLILVVFQGLGWTCVGPLAQTKLMVNWFNRHRGMALGVAIMGISVAGIVMPTVATWLASTLGWRDTYALYAGVLLAVALPLTLLVVRQEPADLGQRPDGDALPAPGAIPAAAPMPSQPPQQLIAIYREFLGSRAFWSVVVTFGLMNGVYSAMITHLPAYLTGELGFSLYQASYVLGVAGLFSLIGKVVFGWMMDRMSAKLTVMVAVTFYLFSTLVFMAVSQYGLIVVAGALFGLGFGGMVPVRSVLLSRLFGVRKFSRVNGLLSFFLAPATFWVLITGYVADTTGTYVTAFQVWAVAFLLAGVVTSLIRLPNRQDAVP